jgi:acyl-coenzyme A synthetase/AMP-(fatty) acid ligase
LNYHLNSIDGVRDGVFVVPEASGDSVPRLIAFVVAPELNREAVLEALRGRDRFLLHGRNADLVNIAGKRTSLAHLNYHLNSIEGVHDGVFVVPEQDRDRVTRLAAYVVAPTLSSEALMSALRERIDGAFLPRPLHFVDALPRNATGKLPRTALDEFESDLAGKRASGAP